MHATGGFGKLTTGEETTLEDIGCTLHLVQVYGEISRIKKDRTIWNHCAFVWEMEDSSGWKRIKVDFGKF
jgi:hypothetical protein